MMLDLEFEVNPRYTVLYAFGFRKEPIVSEELQNKIKNKNKYFHRYLKGRNNEIVLDGKEELNFEEEWKSLLKEEEVKKTIEETEEFKKKIEKDWNENKEKALKLLKKLSGLELPDENIKVYITHPEQPNGRWHKELKCITWGPRDKYPLYSVRYLCHELLHFLTNRYKKERGKTVSEQDKVMHAIIELTDFKIHQELTGERKEEGHEYLDEVKEKIKPKWEKYLEKDTHENIVELAESIEVN